MKLVLALCGVIQHDLFESTCDSTPDCYSNQSVLFPLKYYSSAHITKNAIYHVPD